MAEFKTLLLVDQDKYVIEVTPYNGETDVSLRLYKAFVKIKDAVAVDLATQIFEIYEPEFGEFVRLADSSRIGRGAKVRVRQAQLPLAPTKSSNETPNKVAAACSSAGSSSGISSKSQSATSGHTKSANQFLPHLMDDLTIDNVGNRELAKLMRMSHFGESTEPDSIVTLSSDEDDVTAVIPLQLQQTFIQVVASNVDQLSKRISAGRSLSDVWENIAKVMVSHGKSSCHKYGLSTGPGCLNVFNSLCQKYMAKLEECVGSTADELNDQWPVFKLLHCFAGLRLFVDDTKLHLLRNKFNKAQDAIWTTANPIRFQAPKTREQQDLMRPPSTSGTAVRGPTNAVVKATEQRHREELTIGAIKRHLLHFATIRPENWPTIWKKVEVEMTSIGINGEPPAAIFASFIETYINCLNKFDTEEAAASSWHLFREFHQQIDLGYVVTAETFADILAARQEFKETNSSQAKPMTSKMVLKVFEPDTKRALLQAVEKYMATFRGNTVSWFSVSDRLSVTSPALAKWTAKLCEELFAQMLHQFIVCCYCFGGEKEATATWPMFTYFCRYNLRFLCNKVTYVKVLKSLVVFYSKCKVTDVNDNGSSDGESVMSFAASDVSAGGKSASKTQNNEKQSLALMNAIKSNSSAFEMDTTELKTTAWKRVADTMSKQGFGNKGKGKKFRTQFTTLLNEYFDQLTASNTCDQWFLFATFHHELDVSNMVTVDLFVKTIHARAAFKRQPGKSSIKSKMMTASNVLRIHYLDEKLDLVDQLAKYLDNLSRCPEIAFSWDCLSERLKCSGIKKLHDLDQEQAVTGALCQRVVTKLKDQYAVSLFFSSSENEAASRWSLYWNFSPLDMNAIFDSTSLQYLNGAKSKIAKKVQLF